MSLQNMIDFQGRICMRVMLFRAAVTATAFLAAAAAAHAQGRPGIILYQEDNFRGNQLPVDGPIPNLDRLRFNDRVSSVRVLYGAWELCDDAFFRGRCVTVGRDEPKLGRLGMDDRVSSVRPAGGRGGRYDGGYRPR
jgi:hypothetical protein